MNLTQLLEDQETQPLEEMLAARLGALLGESSPHVLAALALTAAAVRNGHVALDTRALPFVWGGPPLKDSPLVGAPDQDLPLILDGDLLYLHRYHHHESLLAHGLRARAGLEIAVDHETLEATLAKFFPEAEGAGIQDQRRAATVAATRALCVVTGGPGTGKTTLVVRLLATLVSLDAGPVRVRLLAPTGKAAHRLGESVNAQLDALGLTAVQREACPTQAETLHRALGPIRGSRVRFRHDEATPIPADVVIVDEASMVDLAMMRRLVEAVPPTARLIFLGDPHQLASVDAGAVLAAICNPPSSSGQPSLLAGSLAHLHHSWRFDASGGIGALAQAIQAGDVKAAMRALNHSDELTWVKEAPQECELLPAETQRGFEDVIGHTEARSALQGLGQFKILCAIKKGGRGVDTLNAWCEQTLARTSGLKPPRARREGQPHNYEGRPILIQKNDYTHGLYNGDQGLTRRSERGWIACFESTDGVKEIATARLPDHTTAFAMSIHKSQGSEYQSVAIVLPDAGHRMLTRELLYTAVTRARESILLYASEEALAEAIATPTVRVSGLTRRLWVDP